MQSSVAKITSKQLAELLDRQRRKCALTGRELTPDTASIDHIIPLALNGEHNIGNVQFVCTHVNASKGQLSNDEFIAMCREVAAYFDRPVTIENA